MHSVDVAVGVYSEITTALITNSSSGTCVHKKVIVSRQIGFDIKMAIKMAEGAKKLAKSTGW